MSGITTKTYKSGLRLVHDYMPDSRTAAISIAVQVGRVHEDESQAGISHFLEHMCFTATKSKTTLQLETEKDENGIVSNAYTDRECTVYYSKAINEKFAKATELMAESFFNVLLNKEEMETERGVILSEIKMRTDNRDIRLFEFARSKYYGGASMGAVIIGTEDTVNALTQEDLIKFRAEHYIASKVIISIAGGIPFEEVEELVSKHFESNFKDEALPCVLPRLLNNPVRKPELAFIKDDVQQDLSFIMLPGLNVADERARVLSLFNWLFGSTLSSRLVQEVRVKQGLVYNIGTETDSSSDSGIFIIYYGTPEKNQEKALATVRREINKIIEEGITQSELEKAKVLASTKILFKEPDVFTRAASNSTQLIFKGKVLSLSERIEAIKNITLEQINSVAREVLSNPNVLFATMSKNPFKDALKILS